MRAAEIMTREVATILPDTPLTVVADMLLRRRISGVPVVEKDGRLVGIVSEADLMWRVEQGERRRSWWATLLAGRPLAAADYIKTHGTRAADVMTAEVITIDEDTALDEVLDLFDKRRVKRVPVVRDGRVVGIVSRSDLLRALAGRRAPQSAAPGDDEALEDELQRIVAQQPWLDPSLVNVNVTGGIAHFSGLIGSETERRALHVAAHSLDGIRGVDDDLTIGQRPVGGI
ncbi:MAG: CBS domain-containing protein [Alphaproteobacteria bacterium]|nr:CBS domain-containing protein [Alphaproteobacteria bacterium]